MNVRVYWHIYAVNRWREIVGEQMLLMNEAGLLHSESRIAFVTGLQRAHVPGLISPNFTSSVGLSFKFEFPAMDRIWNDARDWAGDHLALYIHTKGVTHPGSAHHQRWRDILNDGVIGRIHEHVAALESGNFDISGQNYLETNGEPVNPHGYFSGNFWVARSDYLRRLPDPRTLDWTDRHQAEQWVCSIPHRAHAFPFIEPMEATA